MLIISFDAFSCLGREGGNLCEFGKQTVVTNDEVMRIYIRVC